MAKWAIGYEISFHDEGETEYRILQDGLCSAKECEEMADLLPGVAYSGPRPVKAAYLIWFRSEDATIFPVSNPPEKGG